MKSGAGLFGGANPNALFIGAVAAVSVIAIGIGVVVFAGRGDGDDGTNAGNATKSSTSSSSSSSTSSTTSTTAPGPDGATTTTLPAPGGGPTAGSPTAAQPGRSYADPTEDPYEDIGLPGGITATMPTCRWDPANGGELQAGGTVTASPETDDIWFIDVYWLQNERELASQTDVLEIDPGATVPFTLTQSMPLPPAEPFRCALEVT